MSGAERVGREVRAFYEAMPFSAWSSADAAEERLRADAVASFPDLHRLLASGAVGSVLDAGCGVGALANAITRHHGIPVTGVDFTRSAIERARATAAACGTVALSTFRVGDLFTLGGEERFDLVTCVGVLHHTHDARRACAAIGGSVAPTGHLFLGLYHAHGRRAFRDHFRGIVARDGEDAAFAAYAALDTARRGDAAHLRSWFRDQVLHPHESLHTLREVAGWLAADGFAVRSTSINAFEPFERIEDLFALEPVYEDAARRALHVERRYFPGFFTVLAQRTGTP